jgi:TetR/AcrR family transcriptional regulator, transcriptional repressor for nem operon
MSTAVRALGTERASFAPTSGTTGPAVQHCVNRLVDDRSYTGDVARASDTRERILAAARSLIELRGYSALGVAEICKAAGVPKGSFYYFFESKEALALAVIDAHWEAQRRAWASVLRSDAAPLERLRQLFEETEADQRARQQSCGTVSGCLFGNLTLELSNQTETIRERLQQIFNTQLEMVEAVITEAVERGDVSVDDVRVTARSLIAQLEGQVLFAKLYNNTRRLDTLWGDCLSLLGVHRAAAEVVKS